MTPTDLLQAGINEAGGDGWSALLSAPSIRELLRLAEERGLTPERMAAALHTLDIGSGFVVSSWPLRPGEYEHQEAAAAILAALAQPTEDR